MWHSWNLTPNRETLSPVVFLARGSWDTESRWGDPPPRYRRPPYSRDRRPPLQSVSTRNDSPAVPQWDKGPHPRPAAMTTRGRIFQGWSLLNPRALGCLWGLSGHLRTPTSRLCGVSPSEHVQGQDKPFSSHQSISRGHVSVGGRNPGGPRG